MRGIYRTSVVSAAVAVVLVLGLSTPVLAANVTWKGVVGDWADNDNWLGNKPVAGVGAYVSGGEAQVSTAEVCHYLRMGWYGGTAGTVRITDGGLDATMIETNGSGSSLPTAVNVEGGYLNLGSNSRLGYAIGTQSTMTVSNTGSVVGASGMRMTLGAGGTGILHMTGGSFDWSGGRVDMGGGKYSVDANNALGRIVIEDGSFQARSMNLGYKGHGELVISGGSFHSGNISLSFYGASAGYSDGATGLLKVVGSDASAITFGWMRFGQVTHQGQGKWVFELDENGITPLQGIGENSFIDFQSNNPTVDILIAEDTPGGVYTLASADRISNLQNVTFNVAMDGSARGYGINMVDENGWSYLQLEVDQMPEPMTVMGLIMGSAGLVGYLRRRRGA